jgi:drug/metabolite transporter (DMT)-like permease
MRDVKRERGLSSSLALRSISSSLSSISSSLLATLFAGLAPIFGKLAYQAGVDPVTLVALRTLIAAGLLWLFYLLLWRRHIAVGWHNLAGCVGMGVANGVGSLLYYNGLTRVDASLGHLLYSMYPFWVFIFLSAAGHPISRLVMMRLGLALLSVFLLVGVPFLALRSSTGGQADPLGVTLMIGAGALYGFHLVLGQWTLVDADPRTVTLYVLTTMAVVVGIARLVQAQPAYTILPLSSSFLARGEPISPQGWLAIVLLAIFPTALARLLVFAGLRRLGGIQASLLGIAEVLVALTFAFFWLGESFTLVQWIGAVLFMASALLIARDTSLQIADEGAWWESLFPEAPAPQDSDEATRKT